MTGVAAILLAAGASTRMGTSKLLLPAPEGTVLRTAVSRLLAAPVDRVILVVGHDSDRLGAEARRVEDDRLVQVVNERWAEGMATSLVAGLAACADAKAVIVALADQPGLAPEVVRRLLDAWRTGAPLAVPVHEGRTGHPVLFDARLFDELRALTGDVGAREVVRRHWAEAARVDAAPLRDLDTPADYDAFLAGDPAPLNEGLDPS